MSEAGIPFPAHWRTCALTPELLREAANEVRIVKPDSFLVRNDVGNLAIAELKDGVWVTTGWIDLYDGSVNFNEEGK